jgi:23S rRNA pseudouridine1911/1915/1917 synthase
VIYEDNHLIAVEKECGIPVQKDSSRDYDLQNMIKDYLKKKYSKKGNVFLGIVHRLDRPVGGIMVFAKTSKAASRLSDQIRKGEWKKKYLAVVEGSFAENSGKLEDYIEKDREKNIVSIAQSGFKGAKRASLNYRVILKNGSRTLVEIDLETGRSHQIRVQFSSRGYPIVNDFKYNPSINLKKGNIALWAYSVEIIHPVKGDQIVLTADMPEYMAELFYSI